MLVPLRSRPEWFVSRPDALAPNEVQRIGEQHLDAGNDIAGLLRMGGTHERQQRGRGKTASTEEERMMGRTLFVSMFDRKMVTLHAKPNSTRRRRLAPDGSEALNGHFPRRRPTLTRGLRSWLLPRFPASWRRPSGP